MNYKKSICLISFSASVFALQPVYAKNLIDQTREISVQMVRSGQVDQGLSRLKWMIENHPKNQKLLADYLVLAYSFNKISQHDLKYLEHVDLKEFPDYAWVDSIKIQRDFKLFSRATKWANYFYDHSRQDQWLVWQGLLLTEGNQPDEAIKIVNQIDDQKLSAEYLSQLSYIYRLLKMPIESLKVAEKALNLQENKNTQEMYVLALSANSDFTQAHRFISDHNIDLVNPNLRHQIKLAEFAQRIKNAIQAQRIQSYLENNQLANEKLDEIIKEMQEYEPKLPVDDLFHNQFYYDYSYVLNARKLNKQVLLTLNKINKPIIEMPAYVRHAAADSYLKLRQPAQSERLYRSLLTEKNYPDYAVYANLYFSLIEQEKFKLANQLIKDMDGLLPTFKHSDAKGVDKVTHDDREEYLALKGLNYAYRNEHKKAEKYFKALLATAPNNIVYQNNYATLLRWREKPEESEFNLAQFNAVKPAAIATRINSMQNSQTVANIQNWDVKLKQLKLDSPEDTGVELSNKEYKDRDRFTIEHQTLISRSTSDSRALLGQLKGSREREIYTRINTPWFLNNYRAYGSSRNRWADYDQGKLSDHRYGIGGEWYSNRKNAAVKVSQNNKGKRTGIQLDWSQWLNDHWQYYLEYDHQADVPLQTLALGNEGKAYSIGFNWQKNESTKAGSTLKFTDISDGNQRKEWAGFINQQIFQSPHHITRANLAAYIGNNKKIDTPYFNPESDSSVELTFSHDWMTWRNYERHFLQHFEATVGAYQQKNYSSNPIYNVFYQHQWHLSRTWKLNYGVGWGVHPYDGENEESVYGLVGFEGRF